MQIHVKPLVLWHCHACPGQTKPCIYRNDMNPDFIPKVCPGDGGLADWKRFKLEAIQ